MNMKTIISIGVRMTFAALAFTLIMVAFKATAQSWEDTTITPDGDGGYAYETWDYGRGYRWGEVERSRSGEYEYSESGTDGPRSGKITIEGGGPVSIQRFRY